MGANNHIFVRVLTLDLPQDVVHRQLLMNTLFQLRDRIRMNLETALLLPFLVISLKRLVIGFEQRFDPHRFQIRYNIFTGNTPTTETSFTPFQCIACQKTDIGLGICPVNDIQPFLFRQLGP